MAGQLFGQPNNENGQPGSIKPETVYSEPVIDSTPDGNISPKKVHDEVQVSENQGINERVYEPGVDSTPDGNLNENVHE